MTKRLLEAAAVKVAPEKFTWMKYKGIKTKLLTHTKRNGDKIKTRLEPNDVFGYRTVKQRSTGKELIQVVLKSDDMDLAYNISPRSFNTNILKVSRTTVLPKKFKKPIDVKAIDKKAKGDAPIEDVVVIKTKVKPKVDEPKQDTPVKVSNPVAKMLTGFKLHRFIGNALKGTDPQLAAVPIDQTTMNVYLIVYDPLILNEHTTDELEGKFHDTSPAGLYQSVIADSVSAVMFNIGKEFKLQPNSFTPTSPNTTKVFKSKKQAGSRYVKILLGRLDTSGLNLLEKLEPELEKFIKSQDPMFISKVRELSKKYNFNLLNMHDIESLKDFANRMGISPEHFADTLLSVEGNTGDDLKRSINTFLTSSNPGDGDGDEVDLGSGYTVLVSKDGNGFECKFLSPPDLADRNVVMWKTDRADVIRQAEQTKTCHEESPYLTKRWNSKWGKVTDVFIDDAPQLDEPGTEMYGIVYSDGTFRKCYGRDMDKTIKQQELESTPEWQEQDAKDREARERALQKSAELKAHNDKVIEGLTKRITDWLGTTTYTAMQKGKILKVMLTRVKYSGTINGILTREEFVRTMVEDMKAETFTREENKYKRPTRQRWNRMSGDEQQEFEYLHGLGVTKTIYSIGNYDVTRYEYLYAKYLGA